MRKAINLASKSSERISLKLGFFYLTPPPPPRLLQKGGKLVTRYKIHLCLTVELVIYMRENSLLDTKEGGS